MKLLALLSLLAGSLTLPAQEVSVPYEVSIPQKEITPNADGKDDFLKIENIAAYPDNQVTISNRHGEKVFELSGYDNRGNVFVGKANIPEEKDLPAGKYFYTIALNDGSNNLEGYISLKR